MEFNQNTYNTLYAKVQPYTKRLLIAFGAIVVVFVLAMIILPMLIDEDAIASRLDAAVEKQFGTGFSFSDTQFELFPSPSIRVEYVRLENIPEARNPYMLEARTMSLHMGWGALFSSEPLPKKVVIQAPLIYPTITEEGKNNWGFWRNLSLDNAMETPIEVVIENGALYYSDNEQRSNMAFAQLNGTISSGSSVKIDINARAENDEKLSFKATCDNGVLAFPADFTSDCTLNYGEGKDNYTLKGTLTHNANIPLAYKGEVDIDASNVLSPIYRWLWKGEPRPEEPLPLIVKGNIAMQGDTWGASLSQVEIADSKSTLELRYNRAAKSANTNTSNARLDVRSHWSVLDTGITGEGAFLSDLLSQLNEALASHAPAAGEVSIRADSIVRAGKEAAQNMHLSGGWQQQTLTFNAMQADIAGGKLQAQTRIASGAESLQSSMSILMQSDNLQSSLDASSIALPPSGVNYNAPARLSAKVNARNQALSLSSLKATIGDVGIEGGANVSIDDQGIYDVETGLLITNYKTYRGFDVWRNGASLFTAPSTFAQTPFAFYWLEQWPHRLDAKMRLKHFDHSKISEENANTRNDLAFALLVEKEFIRLSDVKGKFRNEPLSGRIVIQKNKDMPRAKIVADIDAVSVDASKMLLPYIYSDAPETRWSRKQMNLVPLYHFDGDVKIKMQKLMLDSFAWDNANLNLRLENRRLDIVDFAGDIFNGKMKATGVIGAGEVPSFSTSFIMKDIAAQPFTTKLFANDKVEGTLSLSGKLSGGGISFYNWISSVAGSFQAASANINVAGINFDGVTALIAQNPDVTTIQQRIQTALFEGNTSFSKMTMNGVIRDGLMRTATWGMTARNAVSRLTGSLRLRDRKTDISLLSRMVRLRGNSPEITLELTGQSNTLEHRVDASDVSRYLSTQR